MKNNYVAMGCILYFLAFNCCLLKVTAICDRYEGSQGTFSECLRFQNFDFVPQLATCLPNRYINETSKGRYHCPGDGIYCWYPCMCDLHQQCAGGSVSMDCACDPNDPATENVVAVPKTLPQSCFEPSGNECSWYAHCFRKMYPCGDSPTTVGIIAFMERFCKLWSDHYHSFTFGVRLWLDQARKCHIATLLPLLSQTDGITTCNDIAARASKSNIRCMTLGLYACALDWTEKLQIFWTLIGSEPVTYADQMREIWGFFGTSDHYSPVSERLSLKYSNISSIEILVQLKTRTRNHVTAAKITDNLATQRAWTNKGFIWFGYNSGSDATARGTQFMRNPLMNVRVIFAPKQYDLNARDASDVNMAEIHEVTSLANAVRNRLQLRIDGDVVDIVSMTACSDVDCKLSYLYAKARPIKLSPHKPNAAYVFRRSIWCMLVCATVTSLM
ncbi:hypothetical protein KP79_PYT18915 [Mizuhopecten yessoensis]|uniref:Uncharacterized protein n=1 Tax=Mizuhopecten yessoensis TaxID=6573 RepID=A0A210QZH3_MIZYE|nr:hypothetical protein KP79_PYT18915 [Mizuhopecten yessoensis]